MVNTVDYQFVFPLFRLVKTNERNIRIAYLKDFYKANREPSSTSAGIPKSVSKDYKPSGSISWHTIPVMMIMSVVGVVLGYFIHLGLSWVAAWVMEVFYKTGGCLSIILFPAAILYVISPLAISIAAGALTAGAVEIGKCRSYFVAILVATVVGIATSFEIMGMSNELLYSDQLRHFFEATSELEASDYPIEVLITGLINLLFQDFGYIWSIMLGLAGFGLVLSMVIQSMNTPFCEKTGDFLKETVAQRIHLNSLQHLLFFLYEKEQDCLNNIYLLKKNDADSWDKIPRVEIVWWRSEGDVTNLLEVNVHYQDKEEIVSRLVFSEMMRKQEIELFSYTLQFE